MNTIQESKIHKRTIYNILIFTLAVIISGWIGVIIDRLLPEQDSRETLGMGLWLIFPLLTVVILRTFAGDGWKDAGLRLNITSKALWYLTSKLLKLNTGDISIYLVVGLIWSVWHLPYYLVFLPESTITSVLPVNRAVFFFVAMVNMIAWTVVFVEIYRLTSSIWPAVLMHAVEDSLINPLVIDGYIKIAEKKEILVSPICGIIPTALYLITGLLIRYIRIRNKR